MNVYRIARGEWKRELLGVYLTMVWSGGTQGQLEVVYLKEDRTLDVEHFQMVTLEPLGY